MAKPKASGIYYGIADFFHLGNPIVMDVVDKAAVESVAPRRIPMSQRINGKFRDNQYDEIKDPAVTALPA